VYSLAQGFGKEELLTYGAEVDAGFNRAVFAEMLGSLYRFRDTDLPMEQDTVVALRALFASWRAELLA
jgi:hypothetical protein